MSMTASETEVLVAYAVISGALGLIAAGLAFWIEDDPVSHRIWEACKTAVVGAVLWPVFAIDTCF